MTMSSRCRVSDGGKSVRLCWLVGCCGVIGRYLRSWRQPASMGNYTGWWPGV